METLSEGLFNLIFYWFYILIMNIIATEILAFYITLLKDKGTYGPWGKTLSSVDYISLLLLSVI